MPPKNGFGPIGPGQEKPVPVLAHAASSGPEGGSWRVPGARQRIRWHKPASRTLSSVQAGSILPSSEKLDQAIWEKLIGENRWAIASLSTWTVSWHAVWRSWLQPSVRCRPWIASIVRGPFSAALAGHRSSNTSCDWWKRWSREMEAARRLGLTAITSRFETCSRTSPRKTTS